MTIRAGQLADGAAIAKLMLEHPLWQSYGTSLADQVAKIEALLSNSNKYTIVVESARQEEPGVEIAGFVIFDLTTFGHNGYIQLIGARAGQTGNRIGETLLTAAHQAMLQQRCARSFLLCTSTNVAAQRFYQRHGYVKVGELPNWLQPGIDEYIFCNYQIDAVPVGTPGR